MRAAGSLAAKNPIFMRAPFPLTSSSVSKTEMRHLIPPACRHHHRLVAIAAAALVIATAACKSESSGSTDAFVSNPPSADAPSTSEAPTEDAPSASMDRQSQGDVLSCSDLSQPPTKGSPLWCAPSCCDHVPTAVAVCSDGKWQCPMGTISCCGFNPCSQPNAPFQCGPGADSGVRPD